MLGLPPKLNMRYFFVKVGPSDLVLLGKSWEGGKCLQRSSTYEKRYMGMTAEIKYVVHFYQK